MLPSTTKRLRNTTTPAVTRRPLTTLTPLKGTLRTRENMESMRAALIARSMETRLEEIDDKASRARGPFVRGPERLAERLAPRIGKQGILSARAESGSAFDCLVDYYSQL
jgi:hypothetical protein